MVIGTAPGWALTPDGGTGSLRLPVLVVGAGATEASTGLSGQDLDLDRTAPIRRTPRRATHVLLSGGLVGSLLPTVQAVGGEDLVPAKDVLRACAELTGLAALGTALLGLTGPRRRSDLVPRPRAS
ncbi:hypothetical protein ABZ439_28120 [Streptomyces sp. NPDC005840]|uniref:hypothetical protein n=1 Tax=Streptomyces sp. NPDC005840 TaxID=3157072 RepID=UPI0033E003AC